MHPAAALEMLSFHRFLLGQTNVRLDRFRQAIAERVKPGDTVLDLGTGTGILAFFACLAGARRVYAVETGAVIELAKLLARRNGFEDRIVFLDGASHEIDLPGHVDVLLSDTLGLWQPAGLQSMTDARDRWLRPGGTLIPRSIELFVTPVEVPVIYRRHIDFWNRNRYGIDLTPIRRLATNHCYPVRVKPGTFLTEPARLVRLELHDVKTVAFSGEVCLTARRSGTLHGLCVWIANDLADDIVLSNHPGATTTNYAQGFFPVPRPTAIEEGDRARIRISSYDSVDWRWQVDIEGSDRATAENRARFDQSTLDGFPLPPGLPGRLAPERAPKLSPRGEAERFLLGLSDGGTSIAELEGQLLERYPDLFKSPQDAADFVAEVVIRCA